MRLRYFPNISEFHKILSLKSFGNSRGNSYILSSEVKIAHRLTCGEWKIWQKINKSQNMMKLIVFENLFCFLCPYEQLNLLERVILGLKFTLSLKKLFSTKIEILLRPNVNLSEKLGKASTNSGKF